MAHECSTSRYRLDIEVQDRDLVISVPSARFRAVYYKAAGQPWLILRQRTKCDDYELMADAWRATNDKARERVGLDSLIVGSRLPNAKWQAAIYVYDQTSRPVPGPFLCRPSDARVGCRFRTQRSNLPVGCLLAEGGQLPPWLVVAPPVIGAL
jgi:hypothetical protein